MQIDLSVDHIAASARALADPPTTSRDPRWISVGRGTYPFSSYAAASVAYRATIERLGLGMSLKRRLDLEVTSKKGGHGERRYHVPTVQADETEPG